MIKIAVACYDNVAPIPPVSALFDDQRRTIGRSNDNFLVLPDPNHEVSRSQAAVWSDGQRHTITNMSQATPIRLNGREIASQVEVDIKPGDQIQIGRYVLGVERHRLPGEPEEDDSYEMPDPETVMGDPAEAGVPAAPPLAPGAHAVQALKEAFLRGANIPATAISSDLSPELMELLGKLLAASIQGAIELNALRALVKQEVKADVTMVVVRNNNPLKFFPDSQTVLTQMLRKKMPGFMGPLEAVEDVYSDLCGHQMGVVAGMRATLEANLKTAHTALGRLKPENFQTDLKEPTFADKLVPSRRAAGMWDNYTRQYQSIVGEQRDSAPQLFGAAFLAAYEKEVERFKSSAGNG